MDDRLRGDAVTNTNDTLPGLGWTGAPRASSGRPLASPTAGSIIDGRYQLLAPLGRGGMGQVWSARHVLLGRDVAMKFLLLEAEGLQEMLLNEARVMASFRHPAVVEVYDCGTYQKAPYVVMELLRGETLAACLDREGRLPETRAVTLMLAIAEGMAAAHAHGIVHRDVKPENIFLPQVAPGSAAATTPKLIDFGLALPIERLQATIMGTPAYMAPEHFLNAHIGPAADQWSFAVTLYLLLTGTLPFPEVELTVLVDSVVHAPLAYPRSGTPMDKGLWHLMARGLRKAPDQRFPDMAAVVEYLRAWLNGEHRGRGGTRPTLPAVQPDAAKAAPTRSRDNLMDDLVRKKLR